MNRSILIVDDDSRIRTSLAEVLEDGNTDVRTAEHAEAALSLLADSPADVVLTDVRMPGIGGLELLSLLKPGPVARLLFGGGTKRIANVR